MPQVLATQNAQIVQQFYKSSRVVYDRFTPMQTQSHFGALNTTAAPTAPTTSTTLSQGAQVAIIVAASVVFATILVLLIIALVSR